MIGGQYSAVCIVTFCACAACASWSGAAFLPLLHFPFRTHHIGKLTSYLSELRNTYNLELDQTVEQVLCSIHNNYLQPGIGSDSWASVVFYPQQLLTTWNWIRQLSKCCVLSTTITYNLELDQTVEQVLCSIHNNYLQPGIGLDSWASVVFYPQQLLTTWNWIRQLSKCCVLSTTITYNLELDQTVEQVLCSIHNNYLQPGIGSDSWASVVFYPQQLLTTWNWIRQLSKCCVLSTTITYDLELDQAVEGVFCSVHNNRFVEDQQSSVVPALGKLEKFTHATDTVHKQGCHRSQPNATAIEVTSDSCLATEYWVAPNVLRLIGIWRPIQ